MNGQGLRFRDYGLGLFLEVEASERFFKVRLQSLRVKSLGFRV